MKLLSAVVFVCVCSGALAVIDSVLAHVGSCVLLPCTFSPAPGSEVRLKVRHSILNLKATVFSSDPSEQVSWVQRDFKGRVSLAGDLSSGDCSLTISNVSTGDPGMFEIQTKQRGGSWGQTKNIKLTVTHFPNSPVISAPGALVVGKVGVVNCSVSISCTSHPPRLQWVWERGEKEVRSVNEVMDTVKVYGQLPLLVSSLSFIPSHLVKPRLRCEALYPGNRRSITTMELQVNFPPTDVSIEVHTVSVREGGSALLACVCKADPPVSEYHWSYTQSGVKVSLPDRSHTVRICNITRDTVVQCSVRNTLGQTISPATNLNVQYSPVILQYSSSCEWDGVLMVCWCMVDANPRPAVTWSVNGSVPSQDYNTSTHTTHSKHTLQVTLRGPALTPLTVTCYAFNSIGNDSHTLLHPGGGSMLVMSAVFAVLIFLLLLFLLVVLLYRCRRAERRRRLLTCRPPVFEDAVYQEILPLYINCTEVTHVYTNGSYQLIYQNCTPCFIRTKQTHQRQRRGARRQRERDPVITQQNTERETRSDTDPETAIYIEVI